MNYIYGFINFALQLSIDITEKKIYKPSMEVQLFTCYVLLWSKYMFYNNGGLLTKKIIKKKKKFLLLFVFSFRKIKWREIRNNIANIWLWSNWILLHHNKCIQVSSQFTIHQCKFDKRQLIHLFRLSVMIWTTFRILTLKKILSSCTNLC